MPKVLFLKECGIPRDAETIQSYPRGWRGEISAEDFKFANAEKAVQLIEGEQPKSKGSARTERPATPEAVVAAIVGAYDANDASLKNRDGTLSVKGIEKKLGYQINEAERDAAWAEIQKAS